MNETSSKHESPTRSLEKSSPDSASAQLHRASSDYISTEDLLPLSTIMSSNSPLSGKTEENSEGSTLHLDSTLDESAAPFITLKRTSSIAIQRVSLQEGDVFDARESDEDVGEDDETILNFSMHVKSRHPAVRDEQKEVLHEDTFEPTRYRPQVLINDWYEVSQRRELNKGRHLKLQKGPHASAYDWHYQHPFAKKMVDPEECEKRRVAHNRRLWTYLKHPTEYTDNFNEPFRKK